ncbi:TonB-dependent receptor [Burkholderia sp. Ac-20379]|uniref:TonB-dependent receptor n=1 Tax=Burkholderia sp. Ac-20379 TaxID=2703900 RepID=UPI00198224C1|nr:TonB-dependent receptor [Burkholderia sp. Ac-20379]MBN3727841.1 TonB-dependent receptor [Burkholderia sp. Ac-20379]
MQRAGKGLKPRLVTQLVLASLGAIVSHAASAQTSGDLGAVQSTAAGGAAAAARHAQTASAQAPSQGSLAATEPKSVISRHYIENSTAPTANYTDILAIAPSVTNVDPNGSGLMESQVLGIRGFQDGQYNVTFDGIPFGDSNDFTHHSTSFFTSRAIGGLSVDRGPGDAAQIGFATFGGTVGIQSIEPSMTPKATLFGSYGSFNTWLAGAQFDTGDLQKWGDGRATVGYTQSRSDGYLTDAAQRRRNVFFKLERPIGDNTLLTFFGTYTDLHQNVPVGATAAQIARFGPDFALNGNPGSQSFRGYNFDRIHTDFEYIGLHTLLGGWTIDNKLYTYGYYHNGFGGADPNGETPNGTAFGANNVPGTEMHNNYRAFGDILSAERQLGPGKLQLGAWVTHQSNDRDNANVDDTLNFALLQQNYAMHDTLLTFQPYVQYAWKLPYGLTLTPGVKYVSFDRSITSPMNQKTSQPVDFSHTWQKVLPSVTLHEQISPNLTAYVQYAQGFLAPNLNVFYVNDPASAGQPNPEQTDNYQIGTTYRSNRMTLSADIYYINFRNAVTSRTVGTNVVFSNAGGAVYKGVETEGTYLVGHGFSLYGNLTLNSAKQKSTGDWMPNAAKMTAAAGLLYERGPVNGSFITKFVGRQYGDTGNSQPIGGYAVTNLAAGYTFANVLPWMHNTRLGFEIDNLFNRRSIDALAGYTAQDSTPLYWTVPGRAFVATFTTDF